MSVNKVILLGFVGQDPKISNTQDGREIATFSLATNESWKDKSTGERKEKTEWHRIVVFSSGLVEVVKKYVKKGSSLYIEGAVRTRKWTDGFGNEKYTTEIVLNTFNSFLHIFNSKSDPDRVEEVTVEKDGAKKYVEENVKRHEAVVVHEMDDEIPF